MVAVLSPIAELVDAAHGTERFQMRAEFDLAAGRGLAVTIFGHRISQGWSCYLAVAERKGSNWSTALFNNVTDLDDALRHVASTYPGAMLRPDALDVRATKGPLTPAKLRPLVERAWHEAFGLPVPTPEELARRDREKKAAKKAHDEGMLAELARGPEGVEAFNRRGREERRDASLRRAKLAGCRLDAVDFAGADLEGSDFTGASLAKASFAGRPHPSRVKGGKFVESDLTGADLGRAQAAGADFSGAKLTGAYLSYGSYLRARFVGADLTGARLTGSDLRGADFTDATMSEVQAQGGKFDEATKWPRGFRPPEGLKWVGAGPDPRLAPSKKERRKPRPTDFAGFLARLKSAADASKLDKALAMLKADRFRLFAKVEADHLIGVVKSQSDPNLVYSCRLADDGTYACCTQNLNICGGLRGSPCKHLLVLIVGLAQAGDLDPGLAHDWVQSSRGRKPELNKDTMTDTLLRYKGAEAGEVDWRPTETIPEDFYAL
jgi:uncharacterized protein YjbI with pentapeptide repeats